MKNIICFLLLTGSICGVPAIFGTSQNTAAAQGASSSSTWKITTVTPNSKSQDSQTETQQAAPTGQTSTRQQTRTANTQQQTQQTAQQQSTAANKQFSLFSFILNKGEYFSVMSKGVLSEVSLSGYSDTQLSDSDIMKRVNGTSPFNSSVKTTISGDAAINDYGENSKVTATFCMPSVCANDGLIFSVVIDGKELSLRLPSLTSNGVWPTGNVYQYTLSVNGNSLIVTEVIVDKL